MKKILFLLSLSFSAFAQKSTTIWLDDLQIQTFSEGLRPVKAKKNYESHTLMVNKMSFQRGIGAQSPCVLAFNLDKKALRFQAKIGNDDEGNSAPGNRQADQ